MTPGVGKLAQSSQGGCGLSTDFGDESVSLSSLQRDNQLMSGGFDHVRWLGGATGAGKTTLARAIARQTGAEIYSTDAFIPAHGAALNRRDAPLLDAFRLMDMDQRWVRRGPAEMYRTFPWYHGEGFELLLDDLRGLSGDGFVLVEGFRLLPDLVVPCLTDPAHAVWLVTDPAFRASAFAARSGGEAFWKRTSDPDRALSNLLARDAMFNDRIVADARRNDVAMITVDETTPVDQLAVLISDQFAI